VAARRLVARRGVAVHIFRPILNHLGTLGAVQRLVRARSLGRAF
jgi:hypothetical protein